MVRNPIQEERIKRYFLDATKEILIAEGIDALSVRNVAQRAGYSYATLYNYFKDLSELITLSINDFQSDCSVYVQERAADKPSGKNKLKLIARAYVDYLVQYPSLFNLFYKAGLSSNEANHSTILLPEQLCEVEFQLCLENKVLTSVEVNEIKEKMRFIIPGLLLAYLGRNYPTDYTEFSEGVNNQLNAIFD